jgi:hypothetical protein
MYPRTYEEADGQLTGRCKNSRKIDNNTYLQRRGEDIAIKLHATDVVIFRKSGTVVLNSGGWKTVTTKDRMNKAGYQVWSDRGIWYYGARPWGSSGVATPKGGPVTFNDGMLIRPNGEIANAGPSVESIKEKRKAVQKYSREFIKKLRKAEIPEPGPGDCWGCMGLLGNCAQVHVDEMDFSPRLLWNAVVESPGSSIAMQDCVKTWLFEANKEHRDHVWFRGDSFIWRQIEKRLRKYIYHELGLAT